MRKKVVFFVLAVAVLGACSSNQKSVETGTVTGNRGRNQTDVNGTWKGIIDGVAVTVRITNLGWSISIPDYELADTGTYIRDGDHGRLISDTTNETGDAQVVGTAELLNRNTLTITLNGNSIAPGIYTLTRQ